MQFDALKLDLSSEMRFQEMFFSIQGAFWAPLESSLS